MARRERRLLKILVLVSTAVTAYAGELSHAELTDLLTRIREKRTSAPQMQADLREERVIRLMSKPIATSGKVWFQAPNKFRRETKGNSPSITVSDGQQLWIYYPNFKSAEHYSLGKRSPLDSVIAAINTALNLENVENTFRITGRQAEGGYDLELIPHTASMKRMFQRLNVHVDNDELFVDRTEMWQPNGDRIVTTYSNQTRAPIPSSTFDFTPPPGTEVTNPLGR